MMCLNGTRDYPLVLFWIIVALTTCYDVYEWLQSIFGDPVLYGK